MALRSAAAGFVALQACSRAHEDRPVDVQSAGAGATNAAAGSGGAGTVALDLDAGNIMLADAGHPMPEFSGDVIAHDAAPRRVLWSWTTDAQIEELRRDRVLLTRTERPGVGRANLRGVLEAIAVAGDPLASVLTGADFQKGRFGWTNAWSTLMGWPGESYGNRLVRIELREDAWVVNVANDVLSVVDFDGAPVGINDALATPERIGAVFFVNAPLNPDDPLSCGGSFLGCATGAYREYFINNERMVKSWSLATAEMRAELERSIELIDAYRVYSERWQYWYRDECSFSAAALCEWQGSRGVWEEVHAGYIQSCSIASANYIASPKNLDALIAALRGALFEPDPLIVTP